MVTISSQTWGLLGLIAFGVFVVLTIIREVDLALTTGRPNITIIETRPNVQTRNIQSESKMEISFGLLLRNIGKNRGYQLRVRSAVAPSVAPTAFQYDEGSVSANPIDPDGKFQWSYKTSVDQKYDRDTQGRIVIVGDKEWLIYLVVEYSGSPSGSRYYKDKWCFSYVLGDPILKYTSEKEKRELESCVKQVFKS